MSQVIEGRIATLLGNFGLVPIYALAAAAWVPFDDGATMRFERIIELALVGYVAVILSFLGAVHWGLTLLTPTLSRVQARASLGWSVTPALLGWLALMLAGAGVRLWIVLVFAIGDLILCRVMDARLLPMYSGVPAWYPQLRTRLTIGAVIALLIALPATH